MDVIFRAQTKGIKVSIREDRKIMKTLLELNTERFCQEGWYVNMWKAVVEKGSFLYNTNAK